MFFDGAARCNGAGAGVVFVSPEGEVMPFAFNLMELCSNNAAEYQALIFGLEMAINMKIPNLKIFGDSKLIINQVLMLYEVKKVELLPYFKYASKLLTQFDTFSIEHVPRKENLQADALAKLASTLAISDKEIKVPKIGRAHV